MLGIQNGSLFLLLEEAQKSGDQRHHDDLRAGKNCERCKKQWPIKNIAVIHRTGELQVSDIAVVIAVSSPHRKEAFVTCQYVIDTLKETVPSWKKEFFEDEEVWVAAHP